MCTLPNPTKLHSVILSSSPVHLTLSRYTGPNYERKTQFVLDNRVLKMSDIAIYQLLLVSSLPLIVNKIYMRGHVDKWYKENCDLHNSLQLANMRIPD